MIPDTMTLSRGYLEVLKKKKERESHRGWGDAENHHILKNSIKLFIILLLKKRRFIYLGYVSPVGLHWVSLMGARVQ